MPFKDPLTAKTASKVNALAKRAFVAEIKTVLPCEDCGYHYHYWQMQFDHTERGVKRFDLTDCHLYGWKSILEEMLICDLVCAHCHANRSQIRAGLT